MCLHFVVYFFLLSRATTLTFVIFVIQKGQIRKNIENKVGCSCAKSHGPGCEKVTKCKMGSTIRAKLRDIPGAYIQISPQT